MGASRRGDLTVTTPNTNEPAITAPVETPAKGDTQPKAMVKVAEQEGPQGSIAAFASAKNYTAARAMAEALAATDIVPKQYQNNPSNCLVALELANRTGASVMMVMQNLYVIEGKPSWSSTFLLGAINSCGRFTPIRYEFEGTPSQNGWRCRAVATDIKTGDRLDGEWITWEMVKAEGWLNKKGSKWQTIPGQMMRYRAVAFWSRVYAPDVSLGMHAADEVEDFTQSRRQPSAAVQDLNKALGVGPKRSDVSDDGPRVNGTDIPCEACGAKPFASHKSDCPYA